MESYRILLQVLETGSLSGAAEVMGYTPSAVSRIVAGLEKSLGLTLFYRGKGGMEPTRECRELLPMVRELLYAEDKLQQRAAQLRGAECGRIVMGTAYSHYYRWMTEVCGAFRALHPGIQFEIVNGRSTELAERLEKHEADICLISKREQDMGWILLLEDPLMAMIPADHRLAGAKTFPIEAFDEEPYVETYPGLDVDNSRAFERCGIIPNTQFTTMDIYATYAMVEAGFGIGMNNRINSKLWNGSVKHLPLAPLQSVEIGIAYSREPSPAAAAFLDFIRERLPDYPKQK